MKTHPKRITKADKKTDSDLDYAYIGFLVSKKDYSRIENLNNICIIVFCYENDLVYPVHISDKSFKICMDLLLITDENKLHYVYINDFNRFMCNKTKNKNDILYNVLAVTKFLQGHK